MPLRVHHYYPMKSSNSGDDLVARCIRETVVRHFGPAEFTGFPASNRYPDSDRPIGLCRGNVERNNAEADLVVIGGSNLLEPRKPHPGEPHPMSLVADEEAIRRLRRPLLLVGMGTGSSFGKGIRPYQPRARAAIRALFTRSFAHAVRDQTTVQQLARIGVATTCTGCPVTFLTDRPIARVTQPAPLLVSLPPSRILKRFFGPSFMRLAMNYVRWLRDSSIPTVVTLHERCDVEPAQALVPQGVEVFHSEDLDDLIARFEDSRGVIGFRLHAGLLGVGLGKPIVPVGVDWRGLAFIDTFRLWDLAIRPFRFSQGSKLRRLTQRLLDGDPVVSDRLDRAKNAFRARYEAFFRSAASRFSALARPGRTGARAYGFGDDRSRSIPTTTGRAGPRHAPWREAGVAGARPTPSATAGHAAR
jgi:hypothetical protein